MPVYEAPDDPDEDDDGSGGGSGGYNGPRQSYNFAPGYHGVVYRADMPDWGAGPRARRNRQAPTEADDVPPSSSETNAEEHNEGSEEQQTSTNSEDVHYKLQTMKWGLIPFWTKRNPGYGSVMKTINCRDDSLAQSGGMWASMKRRKRCIVVAQGFYEWLKKYGGREKMPHYVRRKDGKLMCFAGLWDVVQYENDEEKQYTYTIITTDSNKQLKFLHDRMPVILDNGSEKLRIWLDPKRNEWSKELQSLLKPYDGELEVYPVSKNVGKVGNNSPTFIIPIDSKENKSNIANFFARGNTNKDFKQEEKLKEEQPEIRFSEDEGFLAEDTKAEETNIKHEYIHEEEVKGKKGIKREADDETVADQEPPKKKLLGTTLNQTKEKKNESSHQKGAMQKKKTISARSNGTQGPSKPLKSAGTQKITKFFANSS